MHTADLIPGQLAITCIAEWALALIAIGQVVAGGAVVAGPRCTLIDVQLTAWTLEPRYAVAAEAVGIWTLGHTQSTMVAWLGVTAPGLCGPTGIATILQVLALSFWRARIRGTGTLGLQRHRSCRERKPAGQEGRGYQHIPLPHAGPLQTLAGKHGTAVLRRMEGGPEALQARSQQATHIYTWDWVWFQEHLHSREIGPRCLVPPAGLASRASHSSLTQPLRHPVRQALCRAHFRREQIKAHERK